MQRPPPNNKKKTDTDMKGKRGGKTNLETSLMKSYRDSLTTYITEITELMSNSVQYAHLMGWGKKTKQN